MMSDCIRTDLIKCLDYINREVFYFESTYNKTPAAIVMSHGLYNLVSCDRNNFVVQYDNNTDGIFSAYVGIPIEVYPSDKLEYYLAESKFNLD